MHRCCRVAKLFAKHFKVSEQIEYLEHNVLRVASGTPNRLAKLAEEETAALKVDRLELVILDRHQDVKKRSMFDIPEVRTDLFTMLDGPIGARIRNGHAKLVIF
jgi:protein CMS1